MTHEGPNGSIGVRDLDDDHPRLDLRGASREFDCTPLGAFPPLGGVPNCEGCTSNNLGGGTGVSNTPCSLGTCMLPTTGSKFGRVTASGALTLSSSQPIPCPLAASISELRMAIPVGSTGVKLDVCLSERERTGP
jgi:hypothetical protein